MDASSTAGRLGATLEMPPWKGVVSHLAAFLVAVLFLSAGVWKITDPFGWARMVEQLRVPYQFSLPATLALAVSETFVGVLILVPRFRRWGAWLAALLLAVFMVYIAINYQALVGKECSCFPWVKRTIGPGFFVGDALMLLAAILAGAWSPPAISKRGAGVVLGAVAVFAAVSYGSAVTHLTGTKAPDAIMVDGKPYSLQHGRAFLFFFDPHCSHCYEAAQRLASFHWASDVTLIAVPTADPAAADWFIGDTKLKASKSLDAENLKKIFPFGDPPYGVALESGREKGPVAHYEGPEPAETLRKLGFIEP
jgi:uncharacterized membrane protein YphA (DoxX/SURF4 family)